ncbi:MAG: hypothetical protein ACLTMP_11645 [Eggerthella lenta]
MASIVSVALGVLAAVKEEQGGRQRSMLIALVSVSMPSSGRASCLSCCSPASCTCCLRAGA